MEASFQTVPWYSADEWRRVFELLFGPDSNEISKKEGLQILLLWKARCPILPSGIESTLGLLEVDLQAPVTEKNPNISDRLLRLMYSSVLMRFINHMLDDGQASGLTLLRAASKLNIPEWIVNLRHETAHGHEIPPLNLLRNATYYSLNWLYKSYWSQHNDIIENYVVEDCARSKNDFQYDLSQLIYNHNLLAAFSYHIFHVKTLSDIPDDDVKKPLFEFLSMRIYKSENELSWNVKIKVLLSKLLKEIKIIIMKSKDSDNGKFLIGELLNSESMFMSLDVNITEKRESEISNKMSLKYANVWEPLLTLLHETDLLGLLVEDLLCIVENETADAERRLLAAMWVKEIAIGLYKSVIFEEVPHLQFLEEGNVKKDSLFLRLIHHHPNQKYGLTFDLLKPIPSQLHNVDFVYKTLTNVNPYLNIYVKEILVLMEPIVSKLSVKQLLELAGIMSGSLNKPNEAIDDKIHTVEEITGEVECEEMESEDIIEPQLENLNKSKWEVAPSNFDWGKCPIGILPWQTNIYVNSSYV